MSDDKVRDKVESIREDGTKGTLVPFPYEEVVSLIEELEKQAQVMRKHNELISKLQSLSEKSGSDVVQVMECLKELVEEYKI